MIRTSVRLDLLRRLKSGTGLAGPEGKRVERDRIRHNTVVKETISYAHWQEAKVRRTLENKKLTGSGELMHVHYLPNIYIDR
jgi:hypothetical protein